MYLHNYSSLTISCLATTVGLSAGGCLKYLEEISFSAAMVALALFSLLVLRDKIFPVISLAPAKFTISRMTEPATRPRPLLGYNATLELANLAKSSCGMDKVLVSLSLTIFFLALRSALLMASAVSPALPSPKPTLPFLSPATNATEKENRRPPATTRVTRRISKIFWSNSGLGRPKPVPRRPVFLFSFLFSII